MNSGTPDALAPAALGRVVKHLRREKGLTQEQLGERAGYKSGPAAGVSVSRLENGRLELSPERFKKIAKALGLSAEELIRAAEEETNKLEGATPNGRASIKDRVAWVDRAIVGRKQLIADLGQAFDDAYERAKDDFLLRLIEIATHVAGAPKPDPAQLLGDDVPEGDNAEAEAAYSILFTRYGVAQALAESAGGVAARAALDAAATYPTFTAEVERWTAAAGVAISGTTAVAATNGFRTAFRVGTQASRGTASAGRNALLAGVAAAPVALATAGALLWTAKRDRQQQRELNAKLDEAEAEIAETQQNVEALRELMPEATEVLEYIAVHAAHALNRWEAQLGQGPCDWDSLSAAEQQRYHAFAEITAAQLAVANLDFLSLMTHRDDQLERATVLAREIVTQSRKTIASHV